MEFNFDINKLRPLIEAIVREVVIELKAGNQDGESLRPTGQNGDSLTLLLDSRQASKALGISQRTLSSMTTEGTISHVRFGGNVRYAVDDLRDMIRRTKKKGRKRKSVWLPAMPRLSESGKDGTFHRQDP